jgi:alpha-beta hydrolase superfamily lysophospholipase
MRRFLFLLLFPIMLQTLLSGCAHRQFVTQPYPRWGGEIVIEKPEGDPPMILRVLSPPVPDKAPACLLIVHGMNEYVGRYGDIARHFAERYLVAGFDLHAHGLANPVLREADRAVRAGAKEYDVSEAYLAQASLGSLEPLRRDFDRALRRVLELCDGDDGSSRPAFILAHSLGALVSASYLLEKNGDEALRKRIGGIVFLGPAFAVSELPGWRGWLANPIIRLSFAAEERMAASPEGFGALHRLWAAPTSLILNGLFEGLSWPGVRALTTPGTPDWVPDYLTNWEEERQRHRADAYIIRRNLLSYVKGVEREIVGFRRRMAEFTLPYLLVYSERDPITASWGGRDFAAATQHRHPDNEVLFLPDKYHHEHLFAVPEETAEVLRRIDRWLERRLSGGTLSSGLHPTSP